jgi:DNA polymerase III subunit gamma/tau
LLRSVGQASRLASERKAGTPLPTLEYHRLVMTNLDPLTRSYLWPSPVFARMFTVSYQVFARKYRPQVFDDVLGQDHVVRTLKNAIEQNRLAHAYLFVGPRGTGKTSTARILAKALNCVHGPTVSPCGVCVSCTEISQGISLDVMEIDGASNNSVDQIRELRDNVRFAPIRGQFKIYIIDEVHMLTSQAFNALLKTLEEPPAHVKFVFATTEPHKVLPTILSRCQRFDLRRIPVQIIAKHLAFISEREGANLTKGAADAIAIAAEGGLRDAESMLDQLVAFCGSEIGESEVLTVFGLTSEQVVIDLVRSILNGNSSEVLKIVHDQSEAGKDLTKLLGDLLSFFRNLLIYQIDAKNLQEEISDPGRRALEELADIVDAQGVLRLIEQISNVEGTLKWNANKKLHLEIALVRAMQTLGEVGFDRIIDALEELRKGNGVTTPLKPVKKPAEKSESKTSTSIPLPKTPEPDVSVQSAETEIISEPIPEPDAVLESDVDLPQSKIETDRSMESVWQLLVDAVRTRRPLIVSWMESAVPLSMEAGSMVVGLPAGNDLAIETLSRANNRKFIEDLLGEIQSGAWKVDFEQREMLRPVTLGPASPETVDPMGEFKRDPKIRKALEIFKAEIQTEG